MTLTTAERRANGLELVQGLWLPAVLVARLDAYCLREGLTRTEVTRQLYTRLLADDARAWARIEADEERRRRQREDDREPPEPPFGTG